ncbi:4-oxalocrotonate tautomerase family protein [Aquimarina sp. D1M17]|uniref:tautomerase family protein n=1 Tax=Aquimarina acroporae TaxID=2937283 RepID=UPI0020C11006|nr:4-oxalocrotonate tautomerase family protein [Aquimarina acroporae]MCK8520504.1 4-oxalocrotonate tautomerase family protein [Aquimarina acroporae]
MPYVNIKITDEEVTRNEKRQLIEGVTQLLVDILNKNPKTTHVVIEEIPIENWGVDGKQYLGTKKRTNEK